jgi:hypothetical protein
MGDRNRHGQQQSKNAHQTKLHPGRSKIGYRQKRLRRRQYSHRCGSLV